MMKKLLNQRQAWWSEVLTRFDYEKVYRPGKLNEKVDALIRRLEDLPEGRDERLNTMEQVVLKTQNLPEHLGLLADSPPDQGRPSISDVMTEPNETSDPLLGKILEAIRMKNGLQEITIAECIEDEGWIGYRGKLYVPDSDELCLINVQEHHDTALAGHPGWAKTFDQHDRDYYSKEIRKEVDGSCRNCHYCQPSRRSRHSTFRVLRPLSVLEKPRDDISMDFVVGLPECEWFDAIRIVVDRLSKMQHFIPCHTTLDALDLAELFLQEVVRLHGLPLTIISDRGLKLVSTFSLQMCSRVEIDWTMSPAFHPQTDGQTNLMNASMEQYLPVFVNH